MSNSNEQSRGQTKKCPKCQEDIQLGAKKCKHCGADVRNWFVRHKVITGILILFVIGIIGSAMGGENSDQGINNSTVATDENSAAKTDKDVVYTVNEDVMIDDLKIRVINVKSLGNSISQSFGEPITTQGNFIRVDFEVENMGNEGQYMGDMEIVDSENRVFGESDKKYSILGDAAEFFDKLNPNVKTNYSSVFDVAGDAKGLKLKTNGFGLFSTNYVLIDLGVNVR